MKRIVTLIIVVACSIGAVFWSVHQNAKTPLEKTSPKTAQSSGKNTPPTQTPKSFDKKQLSNDDPNSLWVIVNKIRPLQPKSFAPSDLRTPNVALRSSDTNSEMKMRDPAATALEHMFTAAKQDGINLLLASGYRSYGLQVSVYNRNVSNLGQAEADTQSARPGFSEHQTGLAVDVGAASRTCEIESCFAGTAEGKWVAKNAYKFGFVVRYQDGSQPVTGYVYEPWHLRFVGTELSEELVRVGNPTLEAFFNLPAAPNY